MSRLMFVLMLVAGVPSPAHAQEAYQTPPAIVQRVLDAPRLPMLSASPNGKQLLFAQYQGMVTIADLAQPLLRLAGLRINPATNGPFQTSKGFGGLMLRDSAIAASKAVAVPGGANIGGIQWSPDGSRIAFTNTTDSGIVLWMVQAASGEARALTGPVLNGTLGQPCRWMPSGTALLCRLVPSGRGAPPEEPRVPTGPIVQRNEGRRVPVPTFEDLLDSPHAEALFDYYTTTQLALVDAESGNVTPVGQPGIFLMSDPAPGGRYVLVTRVVRPYSYQVPVWSFPQEVEIWNLHGDRVITVFSVPLADNVPVDGVRTGPRDFEWRPGEEATVIYAEALDGGNNRRPAAERDRLVSFASPFTAPVELGRLSFRYAGTMWGRDGLALVSEYNRPTRQLRTWSINTSQPSSGWKIIVDRSLEDRYNDPGTPMLTADSTGRTVVLQSDDGKWLFLRGAGASPDGDHPFLDRMNLEDRKTERLWQSADTAYATVAEVLDTRRLKLITRDESRSTPPNYYYRDPRAKDVPVVAITHLANPAPEFATVRREVVTYERADGVKLSGTLYFPIGYQDGQKVPVIFWIYPREFASAAAAGQVTGSPNRFVLPSGPSELFLLTQGYGVLDNPSLPVVGGDSANNTYVPQTVAGAKAAVDYLMQRGVANGNFGVGGHSYGAFATANLLAHSDLFKAGVARSGAYNRTLTPFGFQNERRTFWEAPNLYLEMMPFTYANKINEPILLIHGMNDNNSGTFPIQSERMYAALKGFGATVEYVQLPYESHGYSARESVMDVIARMISWFDKYVKGNSSSN
jgi:dipeptidyl aminopeptidase/acylaminoacyl peptidase